MDINKKITSNWWRRSAGEGNIGIGSAREILPLSQTKLMGIVQAVLIQQFTIQGLKYCQKSHIT